MNVFKLVLLNLVILMCSFQIIAQEKVEPKKMNYGIGFGLNYSSYHTDSDELSSIYSELLGFSIVVSAERKLSDRFKISMRPETSFIGSGISGSESKFSQVNLNYPITIHGRIVNQFYLEGGVAAQYVAGLVYDDEIRGSTNFADLINHRLLYSIHGGVSYVVADWVDIGVKYNYGLRTIFDLIFTDINGNPIGAQETTNRYLQLAIIIRH